jgi:hypothetical protein
MTPSATSGEYELRIDVGSTAPGAAPPLQIAATAFVPSWHCGHASSIGLGALPLQETEFD